MFRNLSLQTEIFPRNGKYNAREMAALDKSWARVSKDKILPFLVTTENKFAPFFDATMGRPIKYISLLIASLMNPVLRDTISQTPAATTVTVDAPDVVSASANDTTLATAPVLNAATLEHPASPTPEENRAGLFILPSQQPPAS